MGKQELFRFFGLNPDAFKFKLDLAFLPQPFCPSAEMLQSNVQLAVNLVGATGDRCYMITWDDTVYQPTVDLVANFPGHAKPVLLGGSWPDHAVRPAEVDGVVQRLAKEQLANVSVSRLHINQHAGIAHG